MGKRRIIEKRVDVPQKLKTTLKTIFRNIEFDLGTEFTDQTQVYEIVYNKETKEQPLFNYDTEEFETHNAKFYDRYYVYGEKAPEKTIIVRQIIEHSDLYKIV